EVENNSTSVYTNLFEMDNNEVLGYLILSILMDYFYQYFVNNNLVHINNVMDGFIVSAD
ncbi:unnamed protein product, partial [Schistosoma spindalis]